MKSNKIRPSSQKKVSKVLDLKSINIDSIFDHFDETESEDNKAFFAKPQSVNKGFSSPKLNTYSTPKNTPRSKTNPRSQISKPTSQIEDIESFPSPVESISKSISKLSKFDSDSENEIFEKILEELSVAQQSKLVKQREKKSKKLIENSKSQIKDYFVTWVANNLDSSLSSQKASLSLLIDLNSRLVDLIHEFETDFNALEVDSIAIDNQSNEIQTIDVELKHTVMALEKEFQNEKFLFEKNINSLRVDSLERIVKDANHEMKKEK